MAKVKRTNEIGDIIKVEIPHPPSVAAYVNHLGKLVIMCPEGEGENTREAYEDWANTFQAPAIMKEEPVTYVGRKQS